MACCSPVVLGHPAPPAGCGWFWSTVGRRAALARLPRDLKPAQAWLYGLEAQERKGERRHYQRGRGIAHPFSPAGRHTSFGGGGGGAAWAAGWLGRGGGRESAGGLSERGMSRSRSLS